MDHTARGEGRVIWITGLSGAGKAIVAAELTKLFRRHGIAARAARR
ncbi:adenylyl-sulfate kinase [Micromonospora chokoriensis]